MRSRRAKEREIQPSEEEDDAQGRLQDTRNPRRVRVEDHYAGNNMATTAQQAALKRVKDAPRRRGSPSPAKLNKFGANPVQHQEQQSVFGFSQGQSSGSIDQSHSGMFSAPSSVPDPTASNPFDRTNPALGPVSLVRPGPGNFNSSSSKAWENVWANKDPEPNSASGLAPNPSAFGANPFVAPTFNVSVPFQVPNNPFSNPINQPATGYQGSLFNIPPVFSQPVPSANNFFSQAAPPNNLFAFSNNSSSQQPAQVEAPSRADLPAATSVFNFNAASSLSMAAPAAPAASSSIFGFNSNSASTQVTTAPAATPSPSIFTFNLTSKQPTAASTAPACTDLFSFGSAPKHAKAEQPVVAPATPVSTGLFSFSSALKQPEAEQPTAISTAPASTGLFSFSSVPKHPEAAQPIAASAAPLSTKLFSSGNATMQLAGEHAKAVSAAPPSTSLFSFKSALTQQAAGPAAPKSNPFGQIPLASSTNMFSFSPAQKPATESAAATGLDETALVTPSVDHSKFITAEKQPGLEPAATTKSSAAVPLTSSANIFSLGATSKQAVAEAEAKPSPQLSGDNATSAPQMVPPADTVSPSSFDFNEPLPPAPTQSAPFNPFKFGAAPALASNGPIASPPQDRFAEDRQTLKPAAPSTDDSMPKTMGTNLFSMGQATPSFTLPNQNLAPLNNPEMNASSPFSIGSVLEDESLVAEIPDAMDTDENSLPQKQATPVPETKVERKLKKARSVAAIQSQLDRVESNYLQLCINLNNATKERFSGMPSDSWTNVSAWAKYYITERRKLDDAFEKKRCTVLSQMLPNRNTDHSRYTVGGSSGKTTQMWSATSGFSGNTETSNGGSSSVKRKAEEPAENDRTNNPNSGKRSRTNNEGHQTAQAPTELAKEPASKTALLFCSTFKDVMESNKAQDQETQRAAGEGPIPHLSGTMQTNKSYQPGSALSGQVPNRIQFGGEHGYESNPSDAEPGQVDEAELARLREMRRQDNQRSQQEAEAHTAASGETSEQRQVQGVYNGPPLLFVVGQGPPPLLGQFRKTKMGKDWLAARSTDTASGTSSNAWVTAVAKPGVAENSTSGTTPVADSQGVKSIFTPACDYDTSPEQAVRMPKHMASMRSLGMSNKRNRKRKAEDDESAEEDDSLHDILDQGVAELRAGKKFKFMQQAEEKAPIGKPSGTVNPFQKPMAGAVSSTINSSFCSEESSPGVSTAGGASIFDSPKEPATSVPAQNIFGYLSKTNSESGVGNADEDDDDNDHSDGSYDGGNSYNDQTDDSRNGNLSSRSQGHGQHSERSQSLDGQSHQDDGDHSSDDRDSQEHAEGGQSADDKGSQSEGSTYFSRRLGNRLGEAERRRESPDIGFRRSERGRSPSARSIPDEDTRSTSTEVEEPARTGGLFDRISKGSDGKPLRATPADEKASSGSSVFGQPVIPATTENPFPDPFRTSVLGSGASSGPVFNPFKSKDILSTEGSLGGDQTWKESTPIKFSSAPLRAFATYDGDGKQDNPLNRGETLEGTPPPSASEVPKLTFSNPTGGLFGSTPNSPGPNANAAKSADVGFTFGGPPKNMASLLMPSTATSITTSRASTPGATTDTGGESATESAVEGEEDSEQLNLSRVGPGEENETVLFEVRAKAFKFNSQASTFSSHGVGPFRVLKHRDTGKTRILMRSDPNGNVVLNAALLKGIKYEVRQEKIVTVVTVSDDKKFTSWHIKVAKHEDAVELSRILEERKPQ